MNHVTNHSPERKIFKRCLAIFMIVATVVIYNHCGSIVTEDNSGEVIEQHDANVQSDGLTTEISFEELTQAVYVWKPLHVVAAPNNIETNVLVQEEKVESEPKEHKDIKEEETETTIKTRQNTLYYVNDDGYESYLDDCYQDYLYEMCIKYEVEEYYTLFLAQMYHESTFRTDIISATNDHGLMQINVCNHEWLSEELGSDDFLDPYTNIEAGVYIMSGFLHKYNDVEKALVCYNRGESAVINGTYSTSYSREVLADMNLLVELD